MEWVNPFRSIHAAVHRNNGTDSLLGDEKLTVYEAVEGFTKNPAAITGDLPFRGTLTAGKVADFCVLDRDIFAEGADILSARVKATVLGGKLAWGSF